MTAILPAELFDRDAGGARKAAEAGPVIITEAGCPSQVLLSIVEYRRLTQGVRAAVEAQAMPEDDDLDYDPPCLDRRLRLAVFD